MLAAAATVMAPLGPLTVLLAPLMFGLQPPAAPAAIGIAMATTKSAIVKRDTHLFILWILYGLVG